MRLTLPFLPYRNPKVYDSVQEILPLLLDKGYKRVLLVTDKSIRALGLTLSLEQALQQKGIACAVYEDTCPNPTVQNVESARELYLKESCQCIIAFGGGSAMDCAKAVGARIAYPKKSLRRLKGLLCVRRAIPMLIAIPTTAGTGSEVTLTAVITDTEKKDKYTINSFPLIPSVAVLDPEVTYSLPPHLTATTGMDALTHAVEAYIGGSTTKQTREQSLQAVRLIFENIKRAYDCGQDYTARANMLQAAYLAGLAFSKSYVGYVHAVAHSLGGQYNLPHGLANAVLLPHVLQAYGAKIHKKLYALGRAAGVVDAADCYATGAAKFIDAIKKLNQSMNVPQGLSGIRREDIPLLAAHADQEANPLYPVPVLMDADELKLLYELVIS